MVYLHRLSHILYVNILAKCQGQCVNTTGEGLEADSFWSNFIQSSLQLLGTFLCMFIGIYWKIKFLSESQSLNYEYQLWDTPGAEFCLFVCLFFSLQQVMSTLHFSTPGCHLLLHEKKNLKSLSQRRCFNFPRGDWCREVHVTQFHPMRCERSFPGVFVGMISLRMKIGLSNNCLCFFR